MLVRCVTQLKHVAGRCVHAVRARLAACARPASPSLGGGLIADLGRSKHELVLESALLRQQRVREVGVG